MVSYNQFKDMEIRTGKVLQVEEIEGADKLYLITVDIGIETRKIVAGIKPWYSIQELTGKHVIILANLEPRVIRGIESKGMLLATLADNNLSVLTTDWEVPPGSIVS